MSKFLRQMSYKASLSYMMVTSVCSNKDSHTKETYIKKIGNIQSLKVRFK